MTVNLGVGMTRKLIIVGLASVAFGFIAEASAADYEAGKKKAEQVCAACHGPDGSKPITPDIPKLGGQYYDYLVHSLKAYRAGARENAMMSPMAKPLTDQDIKDVAWFFSQQGGVVNKY
jgi:cytochrome c553